MSEHPHDQTFEQFLNDQPGACQTVEDLLFKVLPLMQATSRLHAENMVASIGPNSLLIDAKGRLQLRSPEGTVPVLAPQRLREIQPAHGSALNIIGELRVTRDSELGTSVDDLEVLRDEQSEITRPLFIPGFQCWEERIGHHDQATDIFHLGQILASLACGLDFRDLEDVLAFSANRRNLFRLHSKLNPIVASIIVEMTELNRHNRASDLDSIVQRLERWREQPASLDVERILAEAQTPEPRRIAVLEHLRDRLFDLSRRNRLLYFKPTQANVNLTIASMPMVMHIDSIRPEQLCTWHETFAKQALSGKPVNLQRWLRFEEQPYLNASLDKLIQETRRDRAEYGFSNLRLVIAFLHWHNLKDSPQERIVSPLLWLPVELSKKKGVRDQYLLQSNDSEAELNPVLRHQLRQLYDIQLPESIDLRETSVEELHKSISLQIHQSEPNVELKLHSKPAIQLIHQKAVQRLQHYQRRRRGGSAMNATKPDFSYAADDFRPLGVSLFNKWVQPSICPLQSAMDDLKRSPVSQQHMLPLDGSNQRKTYHVPENEGHRYEWDVDLTQITLANFNYKKMSLVRDYTQLIEQPVPCEGFDRMFSIEPKAAEPAPARPIEPDDQWNVVPADATQNAAVGLARDGRNFIIQGPPGTGKSQTITNLIADYAGKGLRVLFVCEKRAALDVVYHRLQQSGLNDLCCLIHDSQTDKKAFVADLRDSYESWIAKPSNWDQLNNRRTEIVRKMIEPLEKIQRFDQAMSSAPESLNCTPRQLLQAMTAQQPSSLAIDPTTRERLPDWAVWQSSHELTKCLFARVWEDFGLTSFAQHPFSKLSASAVNGDQPYTQVHSFASDATAILEALDKDLSDPNSLFSADTSFVDGQAISSIVRKIEELGLAAHVGLIDRSSAERKQLEEKAIELQRLETELTKADQKTCNWQERLSEHDTLTALTLEANLGNSIKRFFSPAWWKLRGTINKRYDFSQHALRPTMRSILEDLDAAYRSQTALSNAESALAQQYGTSNSGQLISTIDDISQKQLELPRLRAWLHSLNGSPTAAQQVRKAAESARHFAALEKALAQNLNTKTLTLSTIGEYLRDLSEDLADLPDWIPLLIEMHSAPPSLINTLQECTLSLDDLNAEVAKEALARIYRQNPELEKFDEKALTQAVASVSRAEQESMLLNAQLIEATQHKNFLERVRLSSLPAGKLDSKGKEFKKVYAKGRRELEHEFGKSMRYRAIRALASGETGAVINDLKPIWLMSPLSVSDTLPLESDLFDVVIFDEASQIPCEEAIPALSRAQQVIVVGDEMQLPPSSFFSAANDDGDDEVLATEDGEIVAINLDADSLLTQAARNLPATLLAWHYRSRHEALISFSNAAFYDGRLTTVPDRRIAQQSKDTSDLELEDEAMPEQAVGILLDRPVSFLKVRDGLYENRRNVTEAKTIAIMLRELLQRETHFSIGIVAFSEAQQSEIESALDTLANEDSSFATRLEQEYQREDDGQFNGLFVKNLENVQGDERDIILLSVCYAPGPSGKMMMNFGPINQRGGEKRLNVIFSRAKHHMAVISSIHAEAITNTHNEGAAALRAFLQFAQASSSGDAERAQSILSALNPGAQQSFSTKLPPNPIRTALASALREQGHHVHEGVGSSQFRCDLAIVDPNQGSYALAIQLDSNRIDSLSTRERFVFQPTILRHFGWKVIDVPCKQWLASPTSVIARIERLLRQVDEQPELLANPEATQTSPQRTEEAREEVPDHPAEQPKAMEFKEFRFVRNTTSKFWKIAVHKTDMTVCFGRIGSTGQTLIKTFESDERAQAEADKLINEKLRKGYEEHPKPLENSVHPRTPENSTPGSSSK